MEKNGRHEVPAKELDSLASRILLIIPECCQGDRPRVGFQLEKAYWAHLNQFKKDKARSIKKRFTLKDFSLQIFPNVPFLRDHVDIVGDVIDDFKEYNDHEEFVNHKEDEDCKTALQNDEDTII